MGNPGGTAQQRAVGALFCEQMMGAARARDMVALVEKVTGEPCPCKQGSVCPLAPVVQVTSTEVVA